MVGFICKSSIAATLLAVLCGCLGSGGGSTSSPVPVEGSPSNPSPTPTPVPTPTPAPTEQDLVYQFFSSSDWTYLDQDNMMSVSLSGGLRLQSAGDVMSQGLGGASVTSKALVGDFDKSVTFRLNDARTGEAMMYRLDFGTGQDFIAFNDYVESDGELKFSISAKSSGTWIHSSQIRSGIKIGGDSLADVEIKVRIVRTGSSLRVTMAPTDGVRLSDDGITPGEIDRTFSISAFTVSEIRMSLTASPGGPTDRTILQVD